MTSATSPDQPIVKLFWLEQSRSHRILWLLEELKVPYEIEIIHRHSSRLAPPELKDAHPLGKAPVIHVKYPGKTEPVVIAESGLIVEYLLDNFLPPNSTLLPARYPAGQPATPGSDTEEYLRYRYYMHYAEGSLMPLLIVNPIVSMINSPSLPFFVRPITGFIVGKVDSSYLTPNYITHFSFLESQLKSSPNGGKYLCGPNLTGADILMSFPLMAARIRAGLTKEKYPLLWEYVERLENEEGYKKAVETIVEREGKFKLV